jgi:hypothetical protein
MNLMRITKLVHLMQRQTRTEQMGKKKHGLPGNRRLIPRLHRKALGSSNWGVWGAAAAAQKQLAWCPSNPKGP